MSLFFRNDPRAMFHGALHDPATISLATLGISAVSTVGGLIQGKQAADQNANLAAQQARDKDMVRTLATNWMNSIRREDYDALANQDIQKAMRDVSQIMATRGLGLGSSAMAGAMADVSGQTRTAYGKQYLQDKQNATAGAVSAMSGVAQMPDRGWTENPYAGFNAGINSVGQWAANNRFGVGINPVTGLPYSSGQAAGSTVPTPGAPMLPTPTTNPGSYYG